MMKLRIPLMDNLPGQDDLNQEAEPEVDVRTEIANKRKEQRDAENVEHADEIAQLEELHGINNEDEAAPEQRKPEMERINVNGVNSVVPVSDLIEAGKTSVQMDKASQIRFQEASRVRDEYERKLAALNQVETKEKQEEPPTPDNEKLSEDEFVETMMYGENEDNLRKVYQSINDKRSDGNENIDQKVDERIAEGNKRQFRERYEADRVAGNTAFKSDFPEIEANNWMHDIASGEAQRLKQQYPNEAPSRILRQAGLNTRQIVMNTIGMGADHVANDKTKLKESLPKQTRQASVRRPSNTNQKPPSRADIVNTMRSQRGQAEQ